MKLLISLFFSFSLLAQGQAFTSSNFYSGSNLQYRCTALSNPKPATPSTGSISAGTNANPVVLTSTGHNFDLNATPIIIVSGATGGWIGINGSWVATIIDANTFSIPVNSGGFPVGILGTVIFTTYAPRLNQLVWAIQRFEYDGSNNLLGSHWAGDPTLNNATSADMTKACSNRATYAYQ